MFIEYVWLLAYVGFMKGYRARIAGDGCKNASSPEYGSILGTLEYGKPFVVQVSKGVRPDCSGNGWFMVQV